MSYIDGSSSQRRRAVVAVFLAFWTIIVAAEWALPGTEAAPAHGPHPLASAVGAPVAVQLDHPHISQGGSAPSPESFAEAVLPRGTITLIALALVSALAVLPALWRYDEVRPFLMRSGDVITAEEAVRRVLILENPGLRGQSARRASKGRPAR